jgi:aspartate carbamoyltransferase catalytic subunit
VSDAARGADTTRTLGVVECFHVVLRHCPSGAVRRAAEVALAAVEAGGAAALPEQAFLVLTAVRGWQGERAMQVKRSLEAFLAPPRPGT